MSVERDMQQEDPVLGVVKPKGREPTRPPSRHTGNNKFELPPPQISVEEWRKMTGVTNRGVRSPLFGEMKPAPSNRKQLEDGKPPLSALELYFTTGTPKMKPQEDEACSEE